MKLNQTVALLTLGALIISGCGPSPDVPVTGETVWSGSIIQYGKMKEVIGAQQHQGRILLSEAASKPNLFAVGAIEGLTGEFTIVDSKVYATRADSDSEITPIREVDDVEGGVTCGFSSCSMGRI